MTRSADGSVAAPAPLAAPVIDTHTHLNLHDRYLHGEAVPDADELLALARQAGVTKVVQIGCDVGSAPWAVEVAERYLRKGSKVYVEGQIKTRKHTGTDGVERYYPEVVVGAFHGALVLLDKMDTGSRGTPDDYDRDATGASDASAQGVDDEILY